MIRRLLACALAFALADAQADDYLNRQPAIDNRPEPRSLSDELVPAGIVGDAIATRDSDGFERNITRAGAMLKYKSVYDFIAVGASTNYFRQDNRSLRVNSVVGAYRKIDPATAEGLALRAAATTNTDRVQFHGEGTWNVRITEKTGVEFLFNRDAVESVQALQNRILATFVGVSVDHALTDRLTVIGMPTYQHYTDGNEQTGLRGYLIYLLVPEQGLSVQLKARGYHSTSDGAGFYFSPDQYRRTEIGLRLRRSVGDWRVFATADVGREEINDQPDKTTKAFALTAQRTFEKNTSAGFQFSFFRAGDSPNNLGGSESYFWKLGRVYLTIGF